MSAGINLSLSIGQRVRHQDYQGKRVTGVVRTLTVEDRALMATIALDKPIVIPARGEFSATNIYTQHVPAHELAPFDDRDELIDVMQAALRSVCMLRQLGGMLPGTYEVVRLAVDQAEAAIAQAEGAKP